MTESIDRAAIKARADRFSQWFDIGDAPDAVTDLAFLVLREDTPALLAALEEAECRIAAVTSLVMDTDGNHLDGRAFDGLAGAIQAALHPVAETAEKGGE